MYTHIGKCNSVRCLSIWVGKSKTKFHAEIFIIQNVAVRLDSFYAHAWNGHANYRQNYQQLCDWFHFDDLPKSFDQWKYEQSPMNKTPTANFCLFIVLRFCVVQLRCWYSWALTFWLTNQFVFICIWRVLKIPWFSLWIAKYLLAITHNTHPRIEITDERALLNLLFSFTKYRFDL